MVLILPAVALGVEPVVVKPGSGPEAAVEIKQAFDDFMRVSDECSGSGGEALACICEEAAVMERLNTSLEAALEKHPDWGERPLQYKGYGEGSTLQIGIPSLQQQMSTMAARCD